MSLYTFETSDPRKQLGLEAATNRRNQELSDQHYAQQLMLAEADRVDYAPITPQDYVQFVMNGACDSYANQFSIPSGE